MEFCDDPNCKDDAHWPGGCPAERKRRDLGEIATPRYKGFHNSAIRLAAIALANVGPTNFERLMGRGFSGNNFTPCDKCGKPTRGVRCFKCAK